LILQLTYSAVGQIAPSVVSKQTMEGTPQAPVGRRMHPRLPKGTKYGYTLAENVDA